MTGNIPEKLVIVALSSDNRKELNNIFNDYFSELPTIDVNIKGFDNDMRIGEMYVYGDNHNRVHNIFRKFTQLKGVIKLFTLYPAKVTSRRCEYDFRTLSGVYINMSINIKKLKETGKGVYG